MLEWEHCISLEWFCQPRTIPRMRTLADGRMLNEDQRSY